MYSDFKSIELCGEFIHNGMDMNFLQELTPFLGIPMLFPFQRLAFSIRTLILSTMVERISVYYDFP